MKRFRNTCLALLLLGLISCGSSETSEEHLTRANNYLREGNYMQAEKEFKSALILDSASAQARYLLGVLMLETDENAAAAEELRLAESLGWPAAQVRPLIARAFLAQENYLEVLALEYAGLDESVAAELLSLQATAALLYGDEEESQALLRTAREKDPTSLDALLVEARSLMLGEDYREALATTNAVLKTDPKKADAWRLKAQLLWRQQRLEDARTAFDETIRNTRIRFSDLVSRGLINLQLQDFAAAQADADLIQHISSQSAGTSYLVGLIEFNNNNYRKAINSLSQSESAVRQFPLVQFYLSLAYQIDGNTELAAKFASRYVSQVPESIQGRKWLAILWLEQGLAEQVPDILQPVLDYNPNDVGAMNILAEALLRTDQLDASLHLYRLIASVQPDLSIADLPLNWGLLDEAGTLGGAKASEDLEKALSARAAFPRDEILQILAHLQNDAGDEAVRVAESIRWRDLDGISPYNVLAMVYQLTDEQALAQETFQQTLKLDPENPAAYLGVAQIAMEAGDRAAERQYYKALLRSQRDYVPALMRLAALALREGETATMIQWLEQAMDTNPAALEPRLGLALHFLNSGNPERVAPLFRDLNKLQRDSPRVLQLVAQAQMALQQYDSALLALEKLVLIVPEAARFQHLYSIAARNAGKSKKARLALEEAVRLNPKHVPSLIALAEIFSERDIQDKFQQYLTTLLELAPDDPQVLRLRARAAQLAGDASTAMELSQRVFMQKPSTQSLLELTSRQRAVGQIEPARNAMRTWIKRHPDDVAIRLALTDILPLPGDIPEVQAQYEAVLVLDPENIIALNNMAWILRSSNPRRALDYIRKATDMAPENPAVLDTLAMIQHLGGMYELAGQTIAQALAGDPQNRSFRYHYAIIQADLDNVDDAVAALEALLLEDSALFVERDEARALLQRLKG